MKEKRPAGKTGRTVLTIVGIVLALLLAVLIIGFAYMDKFLNLMDRTPDDSTMSSEEYQEFINSETEETLSQEQLENAIDPDDVIWEIDTQPIVRQEHIINILLIGQDRRPGEVRSRSDTMILCTLNTATCELTLTSFMRDMYVPIPGYGDERINVCYLVGGMKLLNKCLEQNFGVHVDGNIEVDFSGFKKVINLIGGIDIELTEAELAFMQKNGCDVQVGRNHLDGYATLVYARNRWTGDADFGRTDRQRKVINAAIEKCKTLNFFQIKNIIEQALPMVTTDMTNIQLIDYALEILPLMKDLKINTQQIPEFGTFTDAAVEGVGLVLVPNLRANRRILEKYTVMETE